LNNKPLSAREQQVTALVKQGLANKEIAYRMGIAEGTVKIYLSKVFRKLHVSSRCELIVLKMEYGNEANHAHALEFHLV
jgi:LuxR family maltose regulon positive regulatory protein